MALNHEDTPRTQKIATREAKKAHHLRRTYSQRVTSGDMTFHQLVKMSKDPDLKALGRINVVKLLAKFPGWTERSARYAFVNNGLSDSLKVKDVKDERVLVILSTLMDSSAASWQKRVKAPPGWPWFGNIANALADIDEGELPRPLREVRYRFADEYHQNDDDKNTQRPDPTPEETSEEITEVLGGRKQRNIVDNLDDLFSEDEEPDIPPRVGVDDFDGLDDLIGDDDDEEDEDDDIGESDDEDTLSEEEINRMLGF